MKRSSRSYGKNTTSLFETYVVIYRILRLRTWLGLQMEPGVSVQGVSPAGG